MSGIFLLVETLNKELVVGEHQCPVLAGLGCILIVIMFVSQIMPLFEGHSANKAGSTDIHLFVYLGLGFGNVLVDKLVCKLQTQSFSLQLDHFKICCKKCCQTPKLCTLELLEANFPQQSGK